MNSNFKNGEFTLQWKIQLDMQVFEQVPFYFITIRVKNKLCRAGMDKIIFSWKKQYGRSEKKYFE